MSFFQATRNSAFDLEIPAVLCNPNDRMVAMQGVNFKSKKQSIDGGTYQSSLMTLNQY